jgi:hypothetical protein
MKNIIIGFITLASLNVLAHQIVGTPVLKGSIKTKVLVNNVKALCKIKVSKPKNMMAEDSFANPAYTVGVDIDLEGSETSSPLRFNKYVYFNNLFTTQTGTEVRDYEYASVDGSKMLIDVNGRIKVISFLYSNSTISCVF